MKRVILLRHGESVWNRENRFTGWTDVDLTVEGVVEAYMAGEELRAADIMPEVAFTSYLKRAIKTLNCAIDKMDRDWIPVHKSWRLNEKHYGSLQGLNKADTAEIYGEEQVKLWRRSYDTPPKPLDIDDPRAPQNDLRYGDVPADQLPLTESLKQTIERLMPYWSNTIFPTLKEKDTIIVVAHGNSLRGIVKHLKNISDEEIVNLNIPTAIPYIFEFDDKLNLVKDYYLGDQKSIQQAVKAAKAISQPKEGKTR